jgi:hypothetical protein
MDAREKLSVTLSIVLFLFLNQRQDTHKGSLPWKGFCVYKIPALKIRRRHEPPGLDYLESKI